MDTMLKHHIRASLTTAVAAAVLLATFAPAGPALAQGGNDLKINPHPATGAPDTIVTSSDIPQEIKDKIYNKPARVREITASEIMGGGGPAIVNPGETIVGGKVRDLESQLSTLQAAVAGLSSNVNSLQNQNEEKAAQYYADVATISTQLQVGTTKGNPRLIRRLQQAEANLENLSSSASTMNSLASEAATRASEASYLLEATRAAYGLSGAVEEDHVRLAELEDSINGVSVAIDRLLNTISDDITRTASYMSSERNNLRALAVGVNNGDLYGKSLGDRPFSSANVFQASASSDMGGVSAQPAVLNAAPASAAMPSATGPRPLVKIRFDKPDVNYEQSVYMAVNEALRRYPDAMFDLVAVHPTDGNAAQIAIESTKARRNAEKVLRTLTQMGLPLERVSLSYTQSPDAKSSEVHLYVR